MPPANLKHGGLAPKIVIKNTLGAVQHTFEHPAISATPIQDFDLEEWHLQGGIDSNHGAFSFLFDDQLQNFINTDDFERKSTIERGWTVEVSLGKDIAGLYLAFKGIIQSARPIFPATNSTKQRVFAIGKKILIVERKTNIKRYQKKDDTDPDLLDPTDTSTRISELAKDLLEDTDHFSHPGLPALGFTTTGIELITIPLPDFQKSYTSIGQAWHELANIGGCYFGIDENDDAFMWRKDSKDSGLLITNDLDSPLALNWDPTKFSTITGDPRWFEDSILGNAYSIFHGVGYELEESDQIQQSANATLDLSSAWIAIPFTPAKDNVSKVAGFLSKVGTLVDSLNIQIVEDDGTGKPSSLLKTRKVTQGSRLQSLLTSAKYFEIATDKLIVVPGTKYHIVFEIYTDVVNHVDIDYQTGTGTYHDSADGITWLPRTDDIKFREYSSKSTRMVGENTTSSSKFGFRDTTINLKKYTTKESAIVILAGYMESQGKENRTFPSLTISAPDTKIELGKRARIIDKGSGINMYANIISYTIKGSAYDKNSNLGAKDVEITIERLSY